MTAHVFLLYTGIDDFSNHIFHHLLVVIQREVWAEGPGEGAASHCCSGTVVSAAGGTQTEVLWSNSQMNSQSQLPGFALRERSIYGLKHDRGLVGHLNSSPCCLTFKAHVLTFINLPYICEVGVQLCRSAGLWLIRNYFLWGLNKKKYFFLLVNDWKRSYTRHYK